jgi:hypothetical protein
MASEVDMKFARWVFWVAGALDLVAVVPLYRMPGSATYYGMIGTLIAWQAAFFVIGWNPKRFRLLMIPAVLEKALWMLTLVVLYTKGQTDWRNIVVNAATHGLLGALFIVAFVRTPRTE